MDTISIKTVSFGDNKDLKEIIFQYLAKLLSCSVQLKFNHWQTCSYAEHKLSDKLIDNLLELIDNLGEASLGIFGRPQIQTMGFNICDNRICGVKYVLDSLDKETKCLCEELCKTNFEDLKNILADIQELINKNKYLSTLE